MISAVFPNLSNVANYAKINTSRTLVFKGVQPLQDDTFQRRANPPFIVDQFYNDEYEGYAKFHTEANPDTIITAHYNINAGNPPKYERGEPLDKKIYLEEIENSRKAADEESSYLKPMGGAIFSTATEIIGKVIDDKDKRGYFYEVAIDDFPASVELSLNNKADYKIGDRIFARGSLELELDED